MKKALMLLMFAPLAGCGGEGNDYFPLHMGCEWTYDVKSGLSHGVTVLKTVREIPVAGVHGYELSISTGISRMAWKDGRLVATVLNNSRFNPPLTLLNGDGMKATIPWEGVMYAGGKLLKGSGTVTQEAENFTVDGKTYPSLKTTLSLRFPQRTIEVQTWYSKGIGMLNQTQRTTTDAQSGVGRFDVQLAYVGGP